MDSLFSNTVEEKKRDKELRKFLKNILGIKDRNLVVYKLALIHKSFFIQNDNGFKMNNERLEYLGDAVLGIMVGDYLFKKYPYQGEGFLTEMRSKIVSRSSLNKLAHKIGLSEHIRYRKETGQFLSMDGDAFEAIFGAIYLDKGYDKAYKVLTQRILSTYLDIDFLEKAEWNYKSKLIDWGQKNRRQVSYQVIDTIEHNSRKQYNVQVLIDSQPQETAIDYSIKAAEQLASEKTYKKLLLDNVITEED